MDEKQPCRTSGFCTDVCLCNGPDSCPMRSNSICESVLRLLLARRQVYALPSCSRCFTLRTLGHPGSSQPILKALCVPVWRLALYPNFGVDGGGLTGGAKPQRSRRNGILRVHSCARRGPRHGPGGAPSHSINVRQNHLFASTIAFAHARFALSTKTANRWASCPLLKH